MTSAVAPLKYPNFRLLWSASIFSATGTFIQSVAASWLMLEMTGSSMWVGLMVGSVTLPLLFLALPAGALADIGLPQHAIPLALLFFNLGVEAGQLLFVAAVLSLAWVGMHMRFWRAPVVNWSRIGAVYVIGSLASFRFIDRIAVF